MVTQRAADDPMHAAIEQAINDFTAKGDPFAIDHDLQVTSYGGTGTTALIQHLLDAGIRMPPGPGQWPHKHYRTPPDADAVPAGFRVIYIVGDPRDALLSIFRRGYAIGRYHNLYITPPSEEVVARLTSLETFLAAGVDDFGLADHVEGWRRHPAGYPVMFLRYEFLDDVWDDVTEFVGIPPEPRLEFRPRRSDWRSLPSPQREQLDALYGDLAAHIETLPPVEVI